MPDLLDRIREELSARLGELRPLVDEHGRLEAAMQALGDVKPPPAGKARSSPAEATKSRARRTPATERRKRAPRGANREAVLRAVSERPGATKAELAAVCGVEPKTLSVLIGRLMSKSRRHNCRAATLFLAAAIVTLLAGCGGSSGSGSKSTTGANTTPSSASTPPPQEVVVNMLVATGNADGKTACSQLTSEAQSDLLTEFPSTEFPTCPALLTYLGNQLKSEQTTALKSARVTKATVKGDTATVEDRDFIYTEGSGPKDPDPAPYKLVKTDGLWKISDLG